jgi:hypothetical protein
MTGGGQLLTGEKRGEISTQSNRARYYRDTAKKKKRKEKKRKEKKV